MDGTNKVGFVIWSIVSAIMLGIGIWSYRSENPVGFFTGTKPPEVKDVKKAWLDTLSGLNVVCLCGTA